MALQTCLGYSKHVHSDFLWSFIDKVNISIHVRVFMFLHEDNYPPMPVVEFVAKIVLESVLSIFKGFLVFASLMMKLEVIKIFGPRILSHLQDSCCLGFGEQRHNVRMERSKLPLAFNCYFIKQNGSSPELHR